MLIHSVTEYMSGRVRRGRVRRGRHERGAAVLYATIKRLERAAAAGASQAV